MGGSHPGDSGVIRQEHARRAAAQPALEEDGAPCGRARGARGAVQHADAVVRQDEADVRGGDRKG